MSSNAIDYHGVLAPLAEACRLAQADILLIADLLRAPQIEGRPPGGFLNVLLRKTAVAIRHVRFISRVWRLGKDRHMLVREFSNVPLALIFPFIWIARGRLLFVVNHNLQWACRRFTEKAAFMALGRMGCRFVFFELIPEEALRGLGIDSKGCCALPVPVPEHGRFRTRSGGIKTVGVIGQFRAEKGIDELLEHLKALSTDYTIVVGVPNVEEFKTHSRFAGDTWFGLKHTGGSDAYRDVLPECDVIVLNHPASGYQYRASGGIADAAAVHVPVVVRRLPVLEAQISQPVRIGESFNDLDRLADVLKTADGNLRSGAYRFEEYAAARSARALAKILDMYIRNSHG